jgi:hypothetical protein
MLARVGWRYRGIGKDFEHKVLSEQQRESTTPVNDRFKDDKRGCVVVGEPTLKKNISESVSRSIIRQTSRVSRKVEVARADDGTTRTRDAPGALDMQGILSAEAVGRSRRRRGYARTELEPQHVGGTTCAAKWQPAERR